MLFTQSELKWLEVILAERFGFFFMLEEVEKSVVMTLPNSAGCVIFDRMDSNFHQSSSDFPCFLWDAEREGFSGPIDPQIPAPADCALWFPLVSENNKETRVHYDILGLVFWMLTRTEENGRTDLDCHHRFPASSSHAFKHGYLERPIVDEWLHILGQVIKRVWPQLELKEHQFRMKVSHDVDVPARFSFETMTGLVRAVGQESIERKNFSSLVWGPWVWLNSGKEIHRKDPANTFDWLMGQSDSHGLTSAFYFICGRTNAKKDALYDPEMPQIRALIKKIHSRGHEIGLHPSYETFQRPEMIFEEFERLKRVCGEEGVSQSAWGGRMHFLRWDQSVTLQAWDNAGFAYDSTLGYADRPGFRCGTCHEYPAFDLVRDRQLALRIRPLIAMDCTVMAPRYLGLGATEQAFQKFVHLKEVCRAVGGSFTLLWHNSYFWRCEHYQLYQRVLDD